MFLIDNDYWSHHHSNQIQYFFADIDLRLSESVNNTYNAHFTDYLLNPTMYNFTFELTTEETIMEITNNLKPKPSCVYDGISTKLWKTCQLEIFINLTLIINQTLSTEIFPDRLKSGESNTSLQKGW